MKIVLAVRLGLCGVVAASLGGCMTGPAEIAPAGTAFADQQSPPVGQGVPGGYLLGPLDTLNVKVFNEPGLLIEEQAIDQSGQFSMPLVGIVQAAGRTTADLQREITDKLNARYLRDAQVSVAVVKPLNYTFTVNGEVQKPGVYQIPGRVTLMQAVALGNGLTRDARLSDTVVIRQIDGQRYAARFNLTDVQTGRFPDPEIKQGDVVIVGLSRSNRLFSTLVAILPSAAGLFIALRN
jgi:polysaccharide biosynthesis/export protein